MEEKQHKRRVRYSGTHPRTYKEKYKEHQPEKYADTISKVISKGSTDAHFYYGEGDFGVSCYQAGRDWT